MVSPPDPVAGAPNPHGTDERSAEVRAMNSQVWDFTKHLVHPAGVYVVLQIALWLALEDNAAFRSPGFGFWPESAVHLVQFFGAWAVLYGTLLRDMGYRTRAATFMVWFSALGVAVAWLWPDRRDPSAVAPLRAVLGADLAVAVFGFVVTMRTWRRAKAEHEAEVARGAGGGGPSDASGGAVSFGRSGRISEGDQP